MDLRHVFGPWQNVAPEVDHSCLSYLLPNLFWFHWEVQPEGLEILLVLEAIHRLYSSPCFIHLLVCGEGSLPGSLLSSSSPQMLGWTHNSTLGPSSVPPVKAAWDRRCRPAHGAFLPDRKSDAAGPHGPVQQSSPSRNMRGIRSRPVVSLASLLQQDETSDRFDRKELQKTLRNRCLLAVRAHAPAIRFSSVCPEWAGFQVCSSEAKGTERDA